MKLKKESEKKVNIIIKELLRNKKQGKSNEYVMMAVEEESEENPSNILGIVWKQLAKQNRRHKAYIDQVTQALKKEDQENSSGQVMVGQLPQNHQEWIQAKREIKKWQEIQSTSRAEHQDPEHQNS